MQLFDERNILQIGPPTRPGETEIPPGGNASKLLTGSGWRKDGPLLSMSLMKFLRSSCALSEG